MIDTPKGSTVLEPGAGAAVLPAAAIAREVTGAPEALAAGRLEEFVSAYFAQAERDVIRERSARDIAEIASHHLSLGRGRTKGEDLLGVVPAGSVEGWDTGGSTLVQIVTDDRPFLVDTVSMVLRHGGWSIRNLYHPQFAATRDEDGTLADLTVLDERVPGDLPESWMCFEAYPPLGRSAGEVVPGLISAVREGLAAVRIVVDDHKPMRAQIQDAVRELEGTPQTALAGPGPERAGDFLRWLDDDNFAFFGYGEYEVRGTEFTLVPGTGLGILRGDQAGGQFHATPLPDASRRLALTKDSRRSPVGRGAYLDYVGIRFFDESGRQVRERRILGLFSMRAHTMDVGRIPVLAEKAATLIERSGFEPESYNAKALVHVINTFPRSELFHASVDELHPILEAVVNLRESQKVRLFVRPWRYGRFVSCTIYMARDHFNTEMRLRMQEVLMRAFGTESIEYQVSVTESLLARVFLMMKLPDGAGVPAYDIDALEHELTAVTRSWYDQFAAVADEEFAPEERGVEFGETYQANYTVEQAVADLRLANQLADASDLRYAMFASDDPEESAELRLKVISRQTLSLTRLMPHLVSMGVDIVDERPSQWNLRGEPVNIYDFGLKLPAGQAIEQWNEEDYRRFSEAFDASLRGLSHADRLNELVMSAGLTWQRVSWLRGIARYLQQAGVQYGQPYIAQVLVDHPDIAAALVSVFETRFDPRLAVDAEARGARYQSAVESILRMLDGVASLDADRILRMFLAVMEATVRTNAFAEDAPALAFKLLPGELDLLPKPRPAYEIFVTSPRVQGVHLRYSQVARGGLRWSDRPEDFRTEVLGLVKAQMVKNTVIVPSGAKGGFVPQNLPDPAADRQAWLAEGVACYQLFISSLLSVTDNIVDGVVVPPADVVRHDSDDPYLVVAADKGTASFSDIANKISVDRGFWMGDAFASGGSAGYDHKGMGITARGAWEAVKRHFFERGIDCQTTDFTCVGIGDMAGDVFGNGMLLSRHIRLIAAFNHVHIFLDPDPDAETSYAERERLFNLPRSTWKDYNPALISAGGGVYERSAKSVPVSAQVRAALNIDENATALTPSELISAILRARVDLLWNGGIGTYVKASGETHAQVGDKANDAVRVNGSSVRAAIVGEGGNLGLTQKGRVEYALTGGRINTDFIDNSAGVDTSDHEVNIKILLQPEVASERLAEEDRNELLASMTDEVGSLVLSHNKDQNLALASALCRSMEMAGSNEEWIQMLEECGLLDRELESLPSAAEVQARMGDGYALTRPELATLLAYTKIRLEQLIAASPLPDDPYMADRLIGYFPKALRERYADRMPDHRLHREIVTTITVNRFVNSMGITAYHRLADETGADVAEIVRAQLAIRSIYRLAGLETAIEQATELGADTETAARVQLARMTERSARWLLHNRRTGIDVPAEVARMGDGVGRVMEALRSLLSRADETPFASAAEALRSDGVEPELAERIAALPWLHLAMPVVEIAAEFDRDVLEVARIHSRLAERAKLDMVASRISALPRQSRWETLARAALRDDLLALQSQLVCAVLRTTDATDPDRALDAWLEPLTGTDATLAMLDEAVAGAPDLASMSVALRGIRSLLR